MWNSSKKFNRVIVTSILALPIVAYDDLILIEFYFLLRCSEFCVNDIEPENKQTL